MKYRICLYHSGQPYKQVQEDMWSQIIHRCCRDSSKFQNSASIAAKQATQGNAGQRRARHVRASANVTHTTTRTHAFALAFAHAHKHCLNLSTPNTNHLPSIHLKTPTQQHTHSHTHALTHPYKQTHTRTHALTHTHTHTHTHTYAHTHTHAHTQAT